MKNLSLALFFSFCSLTVFASPKVIPLKKTPDGHFYTQVTINGINASFILDTGATGTVIDTAQLAYFGIEKHAPNFAGVQAGGVESGQIDVWPISIKSFSIGDKAVNISDIFANNLTDQFSDIEVEEKIVGIIGQDAITNLAALIDIKASTLIIPENVNSPITQIGTRSLASYQSIQLQHSEMGFKLVNVKLNGYAARLLIDSGASESVLDLSTLEQLGFDVAHHPTAKTILSNGVEEPMSVLKDATLQIANKRITDDIFVTDFTAFIQAINQDKGDPFLGVLGNKQLVMLNAVIDLSNAIIYIK